MKLKATECASLRHAYPTKPHKTLRQDESKPSPKTISVYFEETLRVALHKRAKACGRSASGHLRWLVTQDLDRASVT